MNLLGIFVIAVGLAMDAFAVSVSAGTMTLKDKLKTAAVLASAFGFFQALTHCGCIAAHIRTH